MIIEFSKNIKFFDQFFIESKNKAPNLPSRPHNTTQILKIKGKRKKKDSMIDWDENSIEYVLEVSDRKKTAQI